VIGEGAAHDAATDYDHAGLVFHGLLAGY
jgi:hypothetical protein